MNSPELLLLVENCPKGAETLVTRCLHSLTDKGAPHHLGTPTCLPFPPSPFPTSPSQTWRSELLGPQMRGPLVGLSPSLGLSFSIWNSVLLTAFEKPGAKDSSSEMSCPSPATHPPPFLPLSVLTHIPDTMPPACLPAVPPSPELVKRVRDLYHKRLPDVRFLIPVLNGLEKVRPLPPPTGTGRRQVPRCPCGCLGAHSQDLDQKSVSALPRPPT